MEEQEKPRQLVQAAGGTRLAAVDISADRIAVYLEIVKQALTPGSQLEAILPQPAEIRALVENLCERKLVASAIGVVCDDCKQAFEPVHICPDCAAIRVAQSGSGSAAVT